MLEPAEIQARGDNAAQMLGEETMIAAIKATDERLQRAVFATSLAEREKRETAFAAYNGLREILKTLNGWVADAAVSRENDPQQ